MGPLARYRTIVSVKSCMIINNVTLDFANKIITIDHIDLIISGFNGHLLIHVFCKFGNNILKNKGIEMIFVKDTKLGRF